MALAGTRFGVDFNPAANRLRVISDTGQNLRHNIDDPMGQPAAGTTAVDGTLTYPPATTPATGVTAAAYTNNDLDPTTATTLFDLDTTLDQISVQSPANAGSLAPTGKIGVDAGSSAGFDIYSPLRDGKATSATALATLQVARSLGCTRWTCSLAGRRLSGRSPPGIRSSTWRFSSTKVASVRHWHRPASRRGRTVAYGFSHVGCHREPTWLASSVLVV